MSMGRLIVSGFDNLLAHGLSPNLLDGYAQVLTQKVISGAEVELILTEAIYQIASEQFPEWKTRLMACSNFHLYIIPTANLSFAVTDCLFNLGLPRLTGEYDLTSDLTCGATALSWGLELFEWYKKRAMPIEQIENSD